MSNQSFTPGPWSWSQAFRTRDGHETESLMGDNGFGVLSCDGLGNSPRYSDACLIAAAPDLLEALRDVIGWVPGPSCFATSEPRLAVERAQAAIRKATEAQP